MVQKVEWDSGFFGFPVGKTVISSSDKTEEEIVNFRNFKLVYVFSDIEINLTGLQLVDQKVTYEKALDRNEIEKCEEKGDIFSFDPEHHSYNQLLELAYLSGTFSRFKLDEEIEKSYFHKMYKLWLDNSIKKEIAFKTLVSTSEGDISGFVTLGKKDPQTSQIGLIAVGGDYQGRSIGSKLILECEKTSIQEGFTSIQVATQLENKAACRLYEKNDFSIKSVQYIYHLWNK